MAVSYFFGIVLRSLLSADRSPGRFAGSKEYVALRIGRRGFGAPGVPSRHRLVETVPQDVANGHAGGCDTVEEKVPDFRGRGGEDEVRGIDPLGGPSDPDPDPQKPQRPKFLLQRAQPVVPAGPAAALQPYPAGGKVQIVVEDDQVVGRFRVFPVDRRHGDTAPVHVGLRPGEEDGNAFGVPDPPFELPLPGDPYPQRARQPVRRKEPRVVERPGVPAPRIPQPDDQELRGARLSLSPSPQVPQHWRLPPLPRLPPAPR